jgi:hypothetical protein
VDAKDLVGQAGAGLTKPRTSIAAGKVLDDAALADVFGFELDEGMPQRKVVRKAERKVEPGVVVKKPAVKKPAAKRVAPAKSPASVPVTRAIRQPGQKKAVQNAKTPTPSLLPPVKVKPKTKSKAAAKAKPGKGK